ncbi:hypothetical protein [Staphylococcus aureus]
MPTTFGGEPFKKHFKVSRTY